MELMGRDMQQPKSLRIRLPASVLTRRFIRLMTEGGKSFELGVSGNDVFFFIFAGNV